MFLIYFYSFFLCSTVQHSALLILVHHYQCCLSILFVCSLDIFFTPKYFNYSHPLTQNFRSPNFQFFGFCFTTHIFFSNKCWNPYNINNNNNTLSLENNKSMPCVQKKWRDVQCGVSTNLAFPLQWDVIVIPPIICRHILKHWIL